MAIEKIGTTFTQKGLKYAGKVPDRQGFSRLKGIFTQGQNYKNYNQMVETCKRPIIGNIPNELIRLILKTNPSNKAEIIKSIQKAFAETAEVLKSCQKAQLDSIKNLSGYESEIEFLYKMLMGGEHLKLTQSNEEAEIVKSASQHLENSLQSLLQNGTKVQIDYVNEGCFKNCYKLQIYDTDGKKLIHDRALNVYKDVNLSGEIIKAKYKKTQELLNKYSDDEIRKWMASKNIQEQTLFRVNIRRMLLQRYIPENEGNEKIKFMLDNASCHGINAEANSITRLKHIAGHNLSRSNAADTDMFDLKTGFQLEQFSDDTLPKITHKIDFDNLGLSANDLHPSNLVKDRITDFGDLKTNNGLLADNIILSWFKKIINRLNPKERSEVIERFKKLAENPKTPLRDKIQQAINLAEFRLSKNRRFNSHF